MAKRVRARLSGEHLRRELLRGAVSLLLVFHLFCILLAPNKETYLGWRVAAFVEPYVNFLELASSWNFFAPEPGPPPVYVEWELLDRAGETMGQGRFPSAPESPELRGPWSFRERQNRRIAMARFLVTSDARAERVMLPWLCRQNPSAHSVKLWRVVHTIPNLMDVSAGRRRIGDGVDADRRWVSQSFCGMAGGNATLADGATR